MSRPIFALIDCNNFYASCERVFNPKLNNVPVVVLSNNDGCIISLSNEAKAIGIKMGEPIFKIPHIVKKYNIQVLSSNYTLYGDMSQRVMDTLKNFSDEISLPAHYPIPDRMVKLFLPSGNFGQISSKISLLPLAHCAQAGRRPVLKRSMRAR